MQKNFRINKVILTETGGFKDQYVRSLDMQLDNRALSKIEDIVSQANRLESTNITPEQIAHTISDIMLPSAAPTIKTQLPYGWGERRFKFLIEVVEPGAGGFGEKVTVLQGYTDTPEAIVRGDKSIIDDNLTFFVNSVIIVHRMMDPNTGSIIARILKKLSILHLPGGGIDVLDLTHEVNPYQHQQTITANIYAARPEDILIKHSISHDMTGGYQLDYIPDGVLIKPVDANKELVIPSVHLAKTLTGLLKAKKAAGIGYDQSDITSSAVSTTRTRSVYEEENGQTMDFFTAISALYNYEEVNAFKWRDLKYLEPGIDAVTTVTLARDPMAVIQHNSNSEELSNPQLETRLAVFTAEAINALMSENLLSEVALGFTNATGVYDAQILGGATILEGLDITSWLERLRVQFIDQVAPVLTHNNELLVKMTVIANAFGETVVDISIGTGPTIRYIIPTFADSTFSPLLAPKHRFNKLSEAYSDVINTMMLVS